MLSKNLVLVFPSILLLDISASGSKLPCPIDWKFTGLHCYKLLPERHGFFDAEKACQILHPKAHLPVLLNTQDTDGFRTYWRMRPGIACGEGPWIGLTDVAEEGHWVTINGSDTNHFEWSSALFEDNGSDAASDEDCAHDAIESGGWNDRNCDALLHVVCQLPVQPGSYHHTGKCDCENKPKNSAYCQCDMVVKGSIVSCQRRP